MPPPPPPALPDEKLPTPLLRNVYEKEVDMYVKREKQKERVSEVKGELYKSCNGNRPVGARNKRALDCVCKLKLHS